MKQPATISFVILSLLCLVGFAILFLPKKPYCDLDELLLKDNVMSTRWVKAGRVLPPFLPLEGAQDALGVVYENGSDITQHKVYLYKNKFLASFFLWFNDQIFFPSGVWIWTDLEDSEDWKLNGDAEKIRCGNSSDPFLSSLCVAVIRYGPYISEFTSPLKEGVMNQEEFKAIMVSIDDHIASCIKQHKNQQ